MLDYLVVGLGIAGLAFCETLDKEGKSFKVISDASQTSSVVAAGLYNPVILKRFTLAWKAGEQMTMAAPFYNALEKKLSTVLDYKMPVLRRFASPEEQNNWFQAADTSQLKAFLAPGILEQANPKLDAPYGFGEVLGTGRIDLKKMLAKYSDLLIEEGKLLQETFDYRTLAIGDNFLEYHSIKVRNIVFAEGFGVRKNPYFNYLPITGTKGELLTIKARDLKEENAIKSSVFLIPLEDDLYRVGATYKWKDKTNLPTQEARTELLDKLNGFLKCDYEVVDHLAGIRPTVTDRRPLVGRHPKHKGIYILNGLGSRGVMTAPYASKQLFEFIERKAPIHSEMDISRFLGKYRML